MAGQFSIGVIQQPVSETTESTIPPLESGDRLTRPEFERRYAAMPQVEKAELLEGVAYVPSPVRQSHGLAHARIITWLGVYCAATPGVKLNDNASVRLDLDNEVQPDALLRLEPEAGGQSQISHDDYVEGPPELIVEIATSSAAYDLYDKKKVYRRNRVQEYVVWQVDEERLDWWRLEEGRYVSLSPDSEGIWHSLVFPGLSLPVQALLSGDMAGVLAMLQEGLETEEHSAFVDEIS